MPTRIAEEMKAILEIADCPKERAVLMDEVVYQNWFSNVEDQCPEFVWPDQKAIWSGNADMRHYLLPDAMGAEGIGSVREAYADSRIVLPRDNPSVHYVDGDWRLMPVKQETMWELSSLKNTILWMGLSECSAIVARREDGRSFVAHVGYSTRDSSEKVLAFLDTQECKRSEIRVIASVGASQTMRAAELGRPRLCSTNDYCSLGICKENIVSFEYEFEGRGRHRGLSRVLVTEDGVFLFSQPTPVERIKAPPLTGSLLF